MSKEITSAADARKALSQKITSDADFKASGLLYYYEVYARGASAELSYVRGPDGESLYATSWWMRRESLRLQVGHYTVTTALEQISNGFGYQFFVHVSREDENMIAYTPSVEAGEADKQIKTTLGKFLRKHFLMLTDTHIQNIEAAHRAELHGEVLFATTRAEIMRVYTSMAGDSGCMRYKPSHFRFPADLHPSAVYEAPGMAVAYTQDEKGVVKSRSVVWTNPDDAKDKRYVRLYGDSKLLKRKLEAAGFTRSPLTGAKLARIPYPIAGYDDYYVMPYLDGPGGAQGDYRGRYVRLAADEKYIEVIGLDMHEKLERIGEENLSSLASNHEAARVRLAPVPDTTGTCFLSGKTYDRLTDTVVSIASKDGVERSVLRQELEDKVPSFTSARLIDARGSQKSVYVTVSPTDEDIAVRSESTFSHGGYTYVKSDNAYKHCGMRQLSSKYYTSTEYARECTSVMDVDTLTTSTEYVLMKDTVTVVHDDKVFFAHVNDVQALREKGFAWGSPLHANKKLMLQPTAAGTKKSRGGTYFHPQYCNDRFMELEDGTWELSSRVAVMHIFGVRVGVLKAEYTDNRDIAPDKLRELFSKSDTAARIAALHKAGMALSTPSSDYTDELKRMIKRAMYNECDFCVGTNSLGAPTYASTSVSWENLVAGIEKLRTAGDLGPTFAYMVPVFDAIMAFAGPLLDQLDARKAAYEADQEAQRAAARQAVEATRTVLQQEINNLLDTLDNA